MANRTKSWIFTWWCVWINLHESIICSIFRWPHHIWLIFCLCRRQNISQANSCTAWIRYLLQKCWRITNSNVYFYRSATNESCSKIFTRKNSLGGLLNISGTTSLSINAFCTFSGVGSHWQKTIINKNVKIVFMSELIYGCIWCINEKYISN